MKFTLVLIFLSTTQSRLISKFIPIIDERVENCAKPGKDAKAWDLTNYELIAISDQEIYINGSMKVLREINEGLPVHVYAEKFERDKWHVMYFNQKRPDFCASLKNPSEVWYNKLKDKKGCPLNIGDEWKFDMEPVFEFPVQLSSFMAGKWRITIEVFFEDEGKKTSSCRRYFGDIVEV